MSDSLEQRGIRWRELWLCVEHAKPTNDFHVLLPGSGAHLALRKMAGHRSATFLLIARGH